MPRELVTDNGVAFHFRVFDLPLLGDWDVRVKTTFAAPKHGTESHSLSGSVFDAKEWNSDLRMFLPKESQNADDGVDGNIERSERAVGNMVVGTVTQVGSEVSRFAIGESVFGYGSIREMQQAHEDHWQTLGTLRPEDAVCTDPAHVAFVALRDGNVRIGDDVAVFGLGAIGQMAVQIARAAGAHRVLAVDPAALRRECALAHGADFVFSPAQGSVALAIKRATGDKGVDVALETSGSGQALNEAIRSIRQCGTVVHVPWGPRNGTDLHLDEEWHLNRPTLVGSQCWEGWGNPDRSFPLWDGPRQHAAVRALFERGLLTGEGVITPIVSFEEANSRLIDIFSTPERAIKVGVTFNE